MDQSFIDSSNNDTERPLTPSVSSLRLDKHRHHFDDDDATKEAHELFGRTVGTCYGSFSCSHSRIRGRLYVSSRALLFYSSLLGFETRISLDFHDVLEIESFRTTSISVRTFEGETYVFKTFEDRNAALRLLETHVHSTLDTHSIASSVTNNAFSPLLGKPRHRSASSFSSTNLEETFPYNQDYALKNSTPPVGNRRRCVSDSIVNNGQDVSLGPSNADSLPPSLSPIQPPEPTSDVSEARGTKTWETAEKEKPLQEIAVKVSLLTWYIRRPHRCRARTR